MSFGGADLGSARGRIEIDTTQAMASVRNLSGELRNADRMGGVAGQNTARGFSAATTELTIASAAVTGFIGGIVKMGMTFEAQMSAVKAVTGATGDTFRQLEQLALETGAASVFSATESATAIENMAKAGVSVENILGGALEGTVNLAAATGTALESAGTIVATTMNAFQLSGDQAVMIADLFTRAANNTNASVEGLADGIKYAGASFRNLGIDVTEATAVISLLNDQNLVGSQAGTALNQMLTSLVAPTNKAKGVMADLGLEVKDAEGNFRGIEPIMRDVYELTKDMGDVDRAQLLDTLFGTQGGRAAAAILSSFTEEAENADQTYGDYIDKVTTGNTALDEAKTRLDNLKGSMEELSGAIETAAIIASRFINPVLRMLIDAAALLVNGFVAAPPALQAMAVGLLAVVSAGITAAAAMALLGGRMGVFRQVLLGGAGQAGVFARMLALLVSPIGLVIAALALLGLAYKTNFGGFADWVDGIVAKVREVIDVFNVLYGGFAGDTLRAEFGGIAAPVEGVIAWFDALGEAILRVTGIDVRSWLDVIGKFVNRANRAVQKFVKQFRDLDRVFRRGGFMKGLKALFGREGAAILESFGDLVSSLPKLVGEFIDNIETGFEPLDDILDTVGRTFVDAGRFIQEVFQGDFLGAADVAGRMVGRLLGLGLDLLNAAISGIQNTDWSQVWSSVTSAISSFVGDTINLGKEIAVAFTAKLAEGVFGVGDFGQWLRGQLGLPLNAPDGTAGPEGVDGIPMGTLLLKFAAKLAGELWGAGVSFTGWLLEQVGAGAEWTIDTVIPVALKFLAKLAGSIWGEGVSAGQWLYAQTIAGGTIFIDEVIPASLKFLAELAGDIWGNAESAGAWLYAQTIAGGTIFVDTVIPASLKFLAELSGDIWGGFESAGSWLYSKIAKVITVAEKLTANLAIDVADTLGGEIADWKADPSGQVADYLGWGAGVAKDIAVGTVRLVASTVEIVTGEGGASDGGESFITSLVNTITGWLTSAASGVGDLASALGPTLSSLGSGLVDLLVSALTFKADLPGAEQIGQNLGQAVGGAIAAALRFAVNLPDFLTSDAVSGLMESIFNYIATGLIALGAGAIAVPAALLNVGQQIMLAIGAGIVGFMQGMGEGALEGTAVGDVASGLLDGIFNGILGALENVQDFASVSGIIKGIGGTIWGVLVEAISGIFDEEPEVPAATSGSMGKSLSRAISNSLDAGETTGSTPEGESAGESIGRALLTSIATGLERAVSAGGEIVSGVVDRIKGVVRNLLIAAIDALPGPDYVKNMLKDALGLNEDTADEVRTQGLQDAQNLQTAIQDAAEAQAEAIEEAGAPAVAAPEASEDVDDNNQAERILKNAGLGPGVADALQSQSQKNVSDLAAAMDRVKTGVADSVKRSLQAVKDSVPKEPVVLKLPPIRIERGETKGLQNEGVKATDFEAAGGAAPAAVKVPAPDLSALRAGLAQVPLLVAQAMASASIIASAGGTLIGSMLSTSLSSGLTTATSAFLRFAMMVSVILAVVATNAATAAAQIGQNIALGIQQGVIAAVAALNLLAGVIPVILAGAASTAYSSGVAIGQGLAEGMLSQVGAVSAAAASLASAASKAASAALLEASPSKVFIRKGVNAALGLIVGMRRMLRDVARGGAELAEAAIQPLAGPQFSAQTAATAAATNLPTLNVQSGAGQETNIYTVKIEADVSKLRTVGEVVDFVKRLDRSSALVTSARRGPR